MWTVVIIIVLAVAMMLGPIMALRPNKRQRYLAKLRSTAYERGLKVRMTRMPDDSVHPGELVAFYYRSWPGNKTLKQTWLLTRLPFEHGLHFAGEWDWSGHRPAADNWQPALKRALASLPESVIAVEASSQSLAVGWLEMTHGKSVVEAVEEVSSWLDHAITEVPKGALKDRQAAEPELEEDEEGVD